MPAGFWASSRPTLPSTLDIWMPAISNKEWEILVLTIDSGILEDRYVLEYTWLTPQFCLKAEDVKSCDVLRPDQVSNFLNPDSIVMWSSCLEERGEDYGDSPYHDAINKEAKQIVKPINESVSWLADAILKVRTAEAWAKVGNTEWA